MSEEDGRITVEQLAHLRRIEIARMAGGQTGLYHEVQAILDFFDPDRNFAVDEVTLPIVEADEQVILDSIPPESRKRLFRGLPNLQDLVATNRSEERIRSAAFDEKSGKPTGAATDVSTRATLKSFPSLDPEDGE
ncbi:MAG: hypothetical protein ABII13_03055 [Patescibacteria group bacterium]|nr:hypothetical protein [Patescibacteria group bacterium]MBU2508926.1 hypothetical protein [Patescibacteria group bacterium]